MFSYFVPKMATSRRYPKKKISSSRKGKRNVSRKIRRRNRRRMTLNTIWGGDNLELNIFDDLNDIDVTQIKPSLPLYKITVVDNLQEIDKTDGTEKQMIHNTSQPSNKNEKNEWFKLYMNNISMKWTPLNITIPQKTPWFGNSPNSNEFLKAINYIYLDNKPKIPIRFKPSIFENATLNNEIYMGAGAPLYTSEELSNIYIEMKNCYNMYGSPKSADADSNFSPTFYKVINFNTDSVTLTPAGFLIYTPQTKTKPFEQKFYFRKVTCYGKSNDSMNRGYIISQSTYPLKCDEFKTRVVEYFRSLQLEKNKRYELKKNAISTENTENTEN